MHRLVTVVPFLLALTGSALAQDLLAISRNGDTLVCDSRALTSTPLLLNPPGMHGLAFDGTTYWTSGALVPGLGILFAIDPQNGVAIPGTATNDYLSLAGDGIANLYGVRLARGSGSVVAVVDHIDPNTGQSTQVANWIATSAAPTALAVHQGALFGWDATVGLLRIDLATGTATAVQPLTAPLDLRFLCSHPDGRLLGGAPAGNATDLVRVDPTSARLTPLGRLAAFELDGVAVWGNPRTRLGDPCADVAGPATLALEGPCLAGTTCRAVSTNHALGTIGALILGTSSTSWRGAPLPLSVDPLLGTVGCALRVSADVTVFGRTPLVPPGDLAFTLALPNGLRGYTFALQHVALAPVPGTTSWSNGIEVQVLR